MPSPSEPNSVSSLDSSNKNSASSSSSSISDEPDEHSNDNDDDEVVIHSDGAEPVVLDPNKLNSAEYVDPTAAFIAKKNRPKREKKPTKAHKKVDGKELTPNGRLVDEAHLNTIEKYFQKNKDKVKLSKNEAKKLFNIKIKSIIKDDNGDLYVLYKGKDKTLGEGSYGRVKIAQNIKTGEWVAVKIQKKELMSDIESLILEGETEINLGSGIGIAIRHDKKKGYTKGYIFQALLHGEPLETYKEREPGENFNIAIACLEDLKTRFHDKNLIHRDIKAGNIMYDKDNKNKKATLIDMGLVQDISKERSKFRGSEERFFETPLISGTPENMSPEIAIPAVAKTQKAGVDAINNFFSNIEEIQKKDHLDRVTGFRNLFGRSSREKITDKALDDIYSSFKTLKESFGKEKLKTQKNINDIINKLNEMKSVLAGKLSQLKSEESVAKKNNPEATRLYNAYKEILTSIEKLNVYLDSTILVTPPGGLTHTAKAKYSKASDVYAMGVVFRNNLKLDAGNDQRNIRSREMAKQLIDSMLNTDPAKRPTVEAALKSLASIQNVRKNELQRPLVPPKPIIHNQVLTQILTPSAKPPTPASVATSVPISTPVTSPIAAPKVIPTSPPSPKPILNSNAAKGVTTVSKANASRISAILPKEPPSGGIIHTKDTVPLSILKDMMTRTVTDSPNCQKLNIHEINSTPGHTDHLIISNAAKEKLATVEKGNDNYIHYKFYKVENSAAYLALKTSKSPISLASESIDDIKEFIRAQKQLSPIKKVEIIFSDATKKLIEAAIKDKKFNENEFADFVKKYQKPTLPPLPATPTRKPGGN